MEAMWDWCGDLVTSNYLLFKRLRPDLQYEKFGELENQEAINLINQVENKLRHPFLRQWAKLNRQTTLKDSYEFIKANLNKKIADEFKWYLRHSFNLEESGDGLRRSSRRH